jgi:hypothetical protein
MQLITNDRGDAAHCKQPFDPGGNNGDHTKEVDAKEVDHQEEIDAPLWRCCQQDREECDAPPQEGDAPEWTRGEGREGEVTQAGNCHRPVRSEEEGGQSAPQAGQPVTFPVESF